MAHHPSPIVLYIVGTEANDRGRSCEEHHHCGEVLEEDMVAREFLPREFLRSHGTIGKKHLTYFTKKHLRWCPVVWMYIWCCLGPSLYGRYPLEERMDEK